MLTSLDRRDIAVNNESLFSPRSGGDRKQMKRQIYNLRWYKILKRKIKQGK